MEFDPRHRRRPSETSASETARLKLPPAPGLPSTFEQLRVHTGWRSSWTHIVAGKLSKALDDCVLFYEGNTGFAEIYETDGRGDISLLRQHADLGRIGNRSRRWTHVVVGRFTNSPQSSLLLADQNTGFAAIFNVDASGNLIKIREFPHWGDWSHVTTVRLGTSEFSGVLLYNQEQGIGEIHSCNKRALLTLRKRSEGWRKTWSHVVGGFACGTSVLFYEDFSGQCELYQLTDDDVNSLGDRITLTLPPGAATVVTGSFGWVSGYCLYYKETGRIQFVFGIDPVKNTANTVEHYDGLGSNWDLVIPGGFWTPDEEDFKFREGRFSSLLFYDRAAGRGEFYLHDPFGSVEHAPLAGYASPGSVRQGESVDVFVSSSVGPYAIKIYRLGLQREFVTDVVSQGAGSPLDIPRLSYRVGPGWEAAATVQIPGDWPSGVYIARVESLGPADAGEHHLDIPFVVRAREDGSQSNILVFVNDTTYEAYNFWGGRSIYGIRALGVPCFTAPGAGDHVIPWGFRVSFRRPFLGVWPQWENKWTYWEEPLARWMARHGIQAEWATLVDLHNNPGLLDAYTMVVSTGHAEYFSNEMYDGLQAFIRKGGNAAFFSGNNSYWRIRIEDDGDTMVCYKDKAFDPSSGHASSGRTEKTINWTPKESGALTGTELGAVFLGSRKDKDDTLAHFVVHRADHWVFANTGLQKDDPFGEFGDGATVVGYECDKSTPAGASWKALASSEFVFPDAAAGAKAKEIAAIMISEKSGTMFSASTTDWTLGLSQDDAAWTAIDQITLNVFRRLGGLGPVCDVVGFDSHGAVELDRTNIGWRPSWDLMVPGAFTRTDRDQVVLYDRAGGALGIVGFDGTGRANLDKTDQSIGSNWTTIVAGEFIGNHRRQVLLYDKATGDVLLVGFNGSGAINLRRADSGWRPSWDLMVVGKFIGNGRDQVLLYDRAAGDADIVGFNSSGKINLDTSNHGWRPSWDWMVSGHFFGKERNEVWMCDRSANFGEIVGFDAGGHFAPLFTFDGFGTNLGGAVPGDFFGLKREQIVRYADQSGTHGDVMGIQVGNQEVLNVIGGAWQPWDWLVAGRFRSRARSEFLLYTASQGAAGMIGLDEAGNITRQQEFTGWRTTWAMAVAGRFLGNGRDQIALYDRGRI